MTDRKEKSNSLIIATIVGAFVVILVLVIIWLFTNNKETRISEDIDYGSISSVDCESSSSENHFFQPYGAQSVRHRVVATIKNDTLDNISYTFEGVYNSGEKATSAEAWLHADYNKHFRDTNVNPEAYSPNFAAIKSKVNILIYSEGKKLNRIILPVFDLSSDDYDKLSEYSAEDYKRLYEVKGFSCTFHE